MAAKNEFGTRENNPMGFRRTVLARAGGTYQFPQAPPDAFTDSVGGNPGFLVVHATSHATGGEHMRYES
jgi:hypothetical protein